MQKLLLSGLLAIIPFVCACGGDDDSDGAIDSAPIVASTSPAQGATDIAYGETKVTITYDRDILLVSGGLSKISVSGNGVTIVGRPARNGTNGLTLTVNCTAEGAQVTVSVPAGVVTSNGGTPAEAYTLQFTTLKTVAPEPTQDGYETAQQAVSNMGPGWNLGNTLDSHGDWIGNHQTPSKYETAWGQPVTDAHLFRALKEKGFGAVRIPVTWYQHIDADGNVDADWMERVEQIVGYALDAGLYCILNVHHDTGAHDNAWVVANNDRYAATRQRYENLWTQIANRFNRYDEKLLFEGYNEMLDAAHTWNAPVNRTDLQAVNSYAQSFVNVVRATGGNNAHRNLVVTTYAGAHGGTWGNMPYVLQDFVVPIDPCGNQSHLAIEIHSYDPYDWVNTYNMTWTAACTKELENIFRDINSAFISKGYPVIVGEYGSNGAGEKTINGSSTTAQKAEAGRQGADMMRLCRRYGAAGFYWMGLIEGADRSEATFKWTMEQVADSIVKVYQ